MYERARTAATDVDVEKRNKNLVMTLRQSKQYAVRTTLLGSM